MRQAIQYLVDKGLLVRKRGVGTQVVHGRVKRRVELSSLYDDLAQANQRPSTVVLACEIVPADDDVAVTLRLPPGTEIVHLERVRYTRDEPLAIMENWLPVGLADLAPERLEQHGLYELLRAAGVHMRVASQRIGARAATATEAKTAARTPGRAAADDDPHDVRRQRPGHRARLTRLPPHPLQLRDRTGRALGHAPGQR